MNNRVIDNGYCIGCGNCVYKRSDVYTLNEVGLATYKKLGEEIPQVSSHNQDDTFQRICPFSGSSKDEDDYNKELFGSCNNYHPDLGYYNKIYVGWDLNESNRIRSSSGGLVSFVVDKLLKLNIVKVAVLVVYDESSLSGISYQIIDSRYNLDSSRQSKYSLCSYISVLDKLNEINEQFVFVGIPCHVKALRLLAETDNNIKINLKFAMAVFCGHQKTTSFSKFIAWQIGVPPSQLKSFTYRIKRPGFKAHEYFYAATDKNNKQYEKCVTDLKWLDWGIGLFKHNACEFCDDVAGEAADIIFGDAWIKPYTSDYRGTNIVIVRNEVLNQLLTDAKMDNQIELIDSDHQAILASQGANFRHRKEGLLQRLSYYDANNIWYPKRRSSLYKNYAINPKREKTYMLRHNIAKECHIAFEIAVQKNDINIFYNKMSNRILEYTRSQFSMKKQIKAFIKPLLGRFLK